MSRRMGLLHPPDEYWAVRMSAISIRSACSAGVGGYELTVVIELHTLADMEALVDGDRWLSPPS